jgi:hypothetical protein
MSAGAKIIDGLKDAVAGNFSSVTINGQRWVRVDWQTIETAPKDGTYILVYGKHSRAIGYPGRQLTVRWDGQAWESADDGYGVYLTPTHWMPLPKPPGGAA